MRFALKFILSGIAVMSFIFGLVFTILFFQRFFLEYDADGNFFDEARQVVYTESAAHGYTIAMLVCGVLAVTSYIGLRQTQKKEG